MKAWAVLICLLVSGCTGFSTDPIRDKMAENCRSAEIEKGFKGVPDETIFRGVCTYTETVHNMAGRPDQYDCAKVLQAYIGEAVRRHILVNCF